MPAPTTDPESPRVDWSRRGFIATGAKAVLVGSGAAVLGSLGGCTGSSGPATPGTGGPSSTPSPSLGGAADRAAFASAYAAELQILDLVRKTVHRHPTARARLHGVTLLAGVHVRVLAQALHTSAATGTSSPTPPSGPVLIPQGKILGDPTHALVVVAEFLGRAADAAQAAATSSTGDAAAILASLAGSDAGLAAGLRRLP